MAQEEIEKKKKSVVKTPISQQNKTIRHVFDLVLSKMTISKGFPFKEKENII
jgi:hypothetical protein